MYDSDKITVEP